MTEYGDFEYEYHYHIHYHYHYHHDYQHNHHNPQDSFHATVAAPTNTSTDPVVDPKPTDPVEPKVTDQKDCKSTNQVDPKCNDRIETKSTNSDEVDSSPPVTGQDSAATVNGTECKQEDETEVPPQKNVAPAVTFTTEELTILVLLFLLALAAIVGIVQLFNNIFF